MRDFVVVLCAYAVNSIALDQARARMDPCAAADEAYRSQDLAHAEELLTQCIAARPQNIISYLRLCVLYQQQGNRSALYQIASKALKRFPEEPRFYLTVGTQAGREHRYAEALGVFQNAHQRWPQDDRFRSSLADAHAAFGMQLLDEGKDGEAEKHLQLATELASDDIEALLNLGRARYNLNRRLEALAAFDRVLALDANLPRAHFHRGLTRYGMGEFEAAISDLSREIQINPDYPPSFLFRGLAHFAIGKWEQALPDLQIAAERMADTAKAQYSLGRCLIQLARAKEAEAPLRRTLELDPADPGPVNALARILLDSGRDDEARQMFRRAADLSAKQRNAAPGEIKFKDPHFREPQ